MTLLNDSVTQAEDGTWGFQCPGVQGDPCGPHSSTQWPTKKIATARGRQHFDEHKLGAEIMAAVRTADRTALTEARVAAESEALAEAKASAQDPAEVDEAAVRAAVVIDEIAVRATVDRAAIYVRVLEESEFAPAQELHDFRTDQGLVVNDDGSVSVKDL